MKTFRWEQTTQGNSVVLQSFIRLSSRTSNSGSAHNLGRAVASVYWAEVCGFFSKNGGD